MNNNHGASEFDYVIVGAGSAGCVLANRLSADGQQSVLLLEAGPKDTNIWIHVPLGYGKLFKEKSVNWMYQTEPEPGLGGRQVFQPRGKVLGGSSSINGLLYVRGQHEDYDRWRQRGNAGWGYEGATPIRCRKPLSPPRRRAGSRQIPISTARRRKAPDSSRLRRGAADERARRSPIFARQGIAAICTSRLRRWRSASCSKAVAPGPSNTGTAAACARRGR